MTQPPPGRVVDLGAVTLLPEAGVRDRAIEPPTGRVIDVEPEPEPERMLVEPTDPAETARLLELLTPALQETYQKAAAAGIHPVPVMLASLQLVAHYLDVVRPNGGADDLLDRLCVILRDMVAATRAMRAAPPAG